MTNQFKQPNEHPRLREFAFIGSRERFLKSLQWLAENIIEKENWGYDDPKHEDELSRKYGVLYQYIMHTFAKAEEDDKVLKTNTHAIFNTGLFSRVGQKEVYMLFEKNKQNEPEWYFKSFYISSAHEIPQDMRSNLPDYVNYFEHCPSEMYFDANLKIDGNIQHIILDNIGRLPNTLAQLDYPLISEIIEAGIINLRKRIKRNNRIVVPQYYGNKICYLAPLKFGDDFIPIAIEKHLDTYRVNTILTKGMAYCNARLLMRPESNWLVNDIK